MAIRSLLLDVFIFSFCLTSVVSTREECYFKKLLNYSCTPCKFLTFGQEQHFGKFRTYYCPNILESDGKKEYCCYGPLRRPFCCNGTVYVATGLVWLVVAAAMICLIWKSIKFLSWFYYRLWTWCFI